MIVYSVFQKHRTRVLKTWFATESEALAWMQSQNGSARRTLTGPNKHVIEKGKGALMSFLGAHAREEPAPDSRTTLDDQVVARKSLPGKSKAG